MTSRPSDLAALTIRFIPALLVLAWLVTGCSPSTDEGWPPEERTSPPAEESTPAESDELSVDEDSPLAGHPAEAIKPVREFSNDLLTELVDTSIACDLLTTDELAGILGGEWTSGIFRWFESEVNRAPGALRGICVWQEIEHRTTLTLSVYDSSDIAWAALRDHDEDFASRIHLRSLGAGPDIGTDSYRIPHGEIGFDGSCARLDDHIACLSASPRHAERWADIDAELLVAIADALKAGEFQ